MKGTENYSKKFRYGAKIVVGYDGRGQAVQPEILCFVENKISDNLTLLKIAAEQTLNAIFPNRKIGKLKDGYEASFIILNENPLISFEAVKNVNLRFKHGIFIEAKK